MHNKERLHLYALYIALLNDSDISWRRLNYRLGRVKRERVSIMIPYMIGKVIYSLGRDDSDKAELYATHLDNYSRLYRKELDERTIAFVAFLISIFDVRTIRINIPSHDVLDGISTECEVVNYELLKERVGQLERRYG